MILGLTGSYGSGKSTVADMMKHLGATIIDADQIAREVVEPGAPAFEEVRQAFGQEVIGPDGRLDRKALAARVFASPASRRRLEAIIHPRVRERELALIEEYKDHPLIVLNVPLLYENGLNRHCEATCVVAISEQARFERLRQRDGVQPEQIQQRLQAQIPQEEKVARADYIIENSGTLPETQRQVERLVRHIFWKEVENSHAAIQQPLQRRNA